MSDQEQLILGHSPDAHMKAAPYAYLYFIYLAGAALVSTYWPYHMESLGLSESDIGWLFAGLTSIGIGCQLLLAWLSPRLKRTERLLAIALVVTALMSLSIPFAYSALALTLFIYMMLPSRSITLPLLDALTIDKLGVESYDSVRVWGTVGYGLCAAAFGLATRHVDHAVAGRWSLWVFGALMLLMLPVIPILLRQPSSKPSASESQPQSQSVTALLRQPALLGILAMGALHWSAITMFNTFLSLHTKALGYDNAIPGFAIAVAVIAEIVGFAVAGRLMKKRSPATWMPIIFTAGIVRWLGTAFAPNAYILIAWQVVHMLSFALWLSSSFRLLAPFAPAKQRSGVQSLFFAIAFGTGGVLGSTIGGLVMDHIGGNAVFFAAAASELLALFCWMVWFPNRRQEADKNI